MRDISIFISSPGDVAEERLIAARVIERLAHRFAERAVLKPCFWEHLPLQASAHFQPQIPKPSHFDVMVMMLWARLGTRLPEEMIRPDGTRYESGTEFEFEDAMQGFKERSLPHLLVYRKTASMMVELGSNEERLIEISRQKRNVDKFIERWFQEGGGSFSAAFHQFANTSEFEDQLEQHLRGLFEEILRASSGVGDPFVKSAIEWSPQQHGSPFRGLQRFEFEHRAIYFGRTKAINEVLDTLRRQMALGCPFVLVFGNSGAGKSSFLRAGVLPFLVEPGVIDGVGVWRRAIFEPSDSTGELLDGLAAALMAENALPELSRATTEAGLAKLLRDSPEAVAIMLRRELGLLGDALQRDRPLEQPLASRFALLIDPLEEIYTRPGATPEDRERFFAALNALVRSNLVFVLGSMRSDFYERCAEHPLLLELKSGQGQYHLAPPTLVEIGRMIRLPAKLAGLNFEEHPEQGPLDEVLIHAASGDSGALPLLQFTLDELYQRSRAWQTGLLTHESYHALGGLHGAVRTRAEETVAELEGLLGPRLEPTFRAVFSVLVGLKDDAAHHVVRLYSPLNRLVEDPDRKQLVDAFIAARLFVTDIDDEKQPIVTLGHETLLQNWPRLAKWIESNQEFLRARNRIITAAAHWREEGRDTAFLLSEGKPLADGRDLLSAHRANLEAAEIEFLECSIAHADERRRRGQRRARMVVASVSALAVLAAIMAVISIIKAREAASKAREAGANLETAEYRRIIATNSLTSASEARVESELRADESENLTQFLFEDIGARLQPSDPQNRRLVGLITNATLRHYGAVQLDHETPARKAEGVHNIMKVAVNLERMGRYREALDFGSRITKLLDLGPIPSIETGDIGEINDLVARCLNQLGRYDDAEKSYKVAISLSKKENVRKVTEELGELYRHLGRYVESERLLHLDPGTKATVSRLRALAELHRYQERFPEAEQRILEAKKLAEVSVAQNEKAHAELFERRQKAQTAGEIQRLDNELGVLQPKIEKAEDDLTKVRSDLGVLRFDQSQLPEAEKLLREALTNDMRSKGNEHPLVAADQYKLARVLTKLNGFKESDAMLQECRQTLTIAFGSEPNQRMAKCLEAFAALRAAEKRYPEAKDFGEKVLEIRRALFKPPHPEIWKALEQLAEISEATNDREGAVALRGEIDAMKVAYRAREDALEQKTVAGNENTPPRAPLTAP
jgi:tetratricopeptide (TPR) repeat protein